MLLALEVEMGTAGAANLGAPRSLAPLAFDLPWESLFAENRSDAAIELSLAVDGAAKFQRSLWSDIV